MFRIPATLNRVKCASTVLLRQGSRVVRPMSTSAFRFIEDTAKDHDVDALFNAHSNTEKPKPRARFGNSFNRVELLGGVAEQPIERTNRNGNTYVSFNMFTNVHFHKSDGSVNENVDLHSVVVFGQQAFYARRNIQKGSRVLVIGKIDYLDQGSKLTRTARIVADIVQVIAKSAPREDRDREARGGQDEMN